MDIKLLLIIIVCLFCFYHTKYEGYTSYEQDIFDKLMIDYNKIFPDNNRNGGGPQWFHHIYKMNETDSMLKKDFLTYNQMYCGVSGSPLDPDRSGLVTTVSVIDVNDKKITGNYYKCCWPCVCDLQRNTIKADTKTITFKDGISKINVLTINDPCKQKNNIPDKVTSYICENSKTQNGIYSDSNRLIFAVLHPVKETNYLSDKEVERCKIRNSKKSSDLVSGMGDIFVRLSEL